MAFVTIDVTKGITGTIATSNLPTIPVTKGGTGLTSGTTGQFLKFTGSTAVSSAAVDAGKILQVVSSTNGYNQGSTSSTYADISLSASLTPSATSSKILAIANFGGLFAGGTDLDAIRLRIVRDSTEVAVTNNFGYQQTTGENYYTLGLHKEDSPSSTSELTYKVQFKNRESNTVTINAYNGNNSTLTVMEIAG